MKRIMQAVAALMVCLSILAGCTVAVPTPTPAPTPYQIPATRVAAEDPAPFERMERLSYQWWLSTPSFLSSLELTELRSPVAILIWEENTEQYCYAKTDLFDTVTDLSEAATVVFVKVTEECNTLDNKAPLHELSLKYACYLTTKECSVAEYIEAPIALSFKPKVTMWTNSLLTDFVANEECDEAFYEFLSKMLRIAPNASDDATVGLQYALDFTPQSDIDLIRQVCDTYAYPPEADLALNPELLDKSLPIFMYHSDIDIMPSNLDPADYVRPDTLLSSIPEDFDDLHVRNCTHRNLAMVSRHELSRYIGFTEYVGAELLGDYTHFGEVYLPIFRCTIIDSETRQAVAWVQSGVDASLPGNDFINSNQVYRHGGMLFFGTSGYPDFGKIFLDEFYR